MDDIAHKFQRTANSSNGNGTGNAAGMDEELGEGISAQAQHIVSATG